MFASLEQLEQLEQVPKLNEQSKLHIELMQEGNHLASGGFRMRAHEMSFGAQLYAGVSEALYLKGYAPSSYKGIRFLLTVAIWI